VTLGTPEEGWIRERGDEEMDVIGAEVERGRVGAGTGAISGQGSTSTAATTERPSDPSPDRR
jgi:L-aminopeptidase/D-esterase-like protein